MVVGLNTKLDAIQARILSSKLPHVAGWNERRRKAAARYREKLAGLPLTFQAATDDETHVYHLFQIRTDQRDALVAYLREREIDVVVRYPTPIHLQPAFAKYGWREGQYPVAEALAKELCCLPIRPDISEAEIEYVAGCVRCFFEDPART